MPSRTVSWKSNPASKVTYQLVAVHGNSTWECERTDIPKVYTDVCGCCIVSYKERQSTNNLTLRHILANIFAVKNTINITYYEQECTKMFVVVAY
jgi:hypothetical protein